MFTAYDRYWQQPYNRIPAHYFDESWLPMKHYIGLVLPRTAANYNLDARLEEIAAQFAPLVNSLTTKESNSHGHTTPSEPASEADSSSTLGTASST